MIARQRSHVIVCPSQPFDMRSAQPPGFGVRQATAPSGA